MSEALLRLEDVAVALPRGGRSVTVLDHLNLTVSAGEMLGLVGESGSGKTMAALSVVQLLPPGGRISGRILLEGRDLVPLPDAQMRRVRGRQVGMVFQNPLAALNPSHTVGKQIAEAFRAHQEATAAQARARAIELLGEVGIRDPGSRVDEYPHQFSGGMRQRVMIAMALACNPALLIADEPTTGLDPLVARQIMALIGKLRADYRMGVLFITHDLSVIEAHADAVHVLYAGRSVEWGSARAFFALPRHPYSGALLGSVARLGQARLQDIPGSIPEPEAHPAACRYAPRCAFREAVCDTVYPPASPGGTQAACRFPRVSPPAVLTTPASPDRPAVGGPRLAAEHLTVRYAGAGTLFGSSPVYTALQDIVLRLRAGECLGVVGESGSGKTTLGRALLQQIAYEGSITLDGLAFGDLGGSALRAQRRRIQVVFQDPRESLNPRLPIGESVGEPLRLAGLAGDAVRERVAALLRAVGLDPAMAARLPRTVSGGQAQRIAIARALAAEPDVIVLDEPTSALDVSTQAMLLNLLKALAKERALSYVLISHDLACVSFLAHRILVLKDGRAVEFADTETLIAEPRHAYTRSLIAAAPHLHAARELA